MAARLGLLSHDALHHCVSAGRWNAALLAAELLAWADRLVVGPDAVLIVDNTALPKKGTASIGVAPQYATALGKNANCQTPRRYRWLSTLLNESRKRTYIITTSRMISGLVRGSRKGLRLFIRGGSSPPALLEPHTTETA